MEGLRWWASPREALGAARHVAGVFGDVPKAPGAALPLFAQDAVLLEAHAPAFGQRTLDVPGQFPERSGREGGEHPGLALCWTKLAI